MASFLMVSTRIHRERSPLTSSLNPIYFLQWYLHTFSPMALACFPHDPNMSFRRWSLYIFSPLISTYLFSNDLTFPCTDNIYYLSPMIPTYLFAIDPYIAFRHWSLNLFRQWSLQTFSPTIPIYIFDNDPYISFCLRIVNISWLRITMIATYIFANDPYIPFLRYYSIRFLQRSLHFFSPVISAKT